MDRLLRGQLQKEWMWHPMMKYSGPPLCVGMCQDRLWPGEANSVWLKGRGKAPASRCGAPMCKCQERVWAGEHNSVWLKGRGRAALLRRRAPKRQHHLRRAMHRTFHWTDGLR